MGIKSIKDLDLKQKRVLIRVDFNVPLDENSRITDDARIKGALSTIPTQCALKGMMSRNHRKQ